MAPKTPTLGGLIELALESKLLDCHFAFPGKVVSYDAAKQTAAIQPAVKQTWVDSLGERHTEKLPQLQNVPVLWQQGGGFQITCPLAAGDNVFVLISESAMDNWRDRNDVTDPSDTRRNDLSDAVPNS